jgi:membrane-anchored protein YejM (alkaline phosphatase superfamily)
MKWFRFRREKRYQVLGDEEDFLLVTWDSCRYDAFCQARTSRLDEFGPARCAWSMATYTLPAHVAMFQGFLPHVHAAEPFYNRYCQQLWRISHRHVATRPLVTFPTRSGGVVAGFRGRGYFTAGSGAMEWFRDAPVLRHGFEQFQHAGTAARKQNEWLAWAVAKKSRGRPCFLFVNYGETHSPFRHEGMPEDPALDQRFSKRRLFNQSGVLRQDWHFDREGFARQVACAEFLDARTGELIDLLRQRGRPTTVVVCGDHGECFGEHGMYGHGFYHEKVMQVPMLIFRLNAPPHALPEPAPAVAAAPHRTAA